MPASLDVQIRSQIARYLHGDASLSEFDQWFAENTWNVRTSGNPLAVDLTYQIELLLGDASAEGWTEDQLKLQLHGFVEDYQAIVVFGGTVVPGPRFGASDQAVASNQVLTGDDQPQILVRQAREEAYA